MKDIFAQLSKNCKKHMDGLPKYKIALLGDCSTQHLGTALKGVAYTHGMALNVFDADYNQIFIQVMNPHSELYEFEPESILFFMCVEKLYESWCSTPLDKRSTFATTAMDIILEYWDYVSSNCSAKILQLTFAEKDDGIFGNYGHIFQKSFIYQLKKLNVLLMEAGSKNKNVFLIDLCEIQSQVGQNQFFDPKFYYIAKMPISLVALPLVASRAIEILRAMHGELKKCVVLDLDNTLWGGVIGDEGLSGIEIGELGQGQAFSNFQLWLKELKKRGILLAVCSKNEEKTAKEPFEKHKDMVLQLEDFSAFVANWEDKASNIARIQQILNIGMNSIVFVDDNPFERELVRSLLPEVTVPELPEDPAEYVSYLKSLRLFETVSYSDEDAKRTDLYRAEAQRTALQQQYANFDEYLQSLEMVADSAPFDSFHIPRISQLTQRSNQFNLRTIRYTEGEIQQIMENSRYITLYFTLRDKLADHGLISVVILEKQSDGVTLFINTWLMSCRVLKRGMEEFIIQTIVDTARKHGFCRVTGEYIQTPKNAMVQDIYERMGFSPFGDNQFLAKTADFKPLKTFIKEQ